MLSSAGAWTFGWAALAAIGTIGLALATFVLGLVAHHANRFAQRGVEIATAELQASMLPLLEPTWTISGEERRKLRAGSTSAPHDRFTYADVDGPDEERTPYAHEVDIYGNVSSVYCSIPIRNVGHGIARVSTRALPRALSVPDRAWTDGRATRGLIPPGMGARLNFRLSGVRQEIYAEVVYTDITGEQETRLRLYIKRIEDPETHDSAYEIRGSALYDGIGNIPASLHTMTGDRRVLDPQPIETSVHA